MELIVFDLDGTLLNRNSQISKFTGITLSMLRKNKLRYTAATGRTLHSAMHVLSGHQFDYPLILKNGVLTYDPMEKRYTDTQLLDLPDIIPFSDMLLDNGVTPFFFTIDSKYHHAIYHRKRLSPSEAQVLQIFERESHVPTRELTEIPEDARISNLSAIGAPHIISEICEAVNQSPNLVAFSGSAIENSDIHWVDIHNSSGSKRNAVLALKSRLGISKIICFGDSDNDLSLFLEADEAYAPVNAKSAIKNIATAVLDHHDEDGVARFLRLRFGLT